MVSNQVRASDLPVALERDIFLRRLLRELAGSLEDVVGMDEAAGYLSVVGAAMGEHIDSEYRRALKVERLSRSQVADVLVDLKRRIQGRFSVIEETEEKIVFANTACPFADMVKDRHSICMVTSNMFGYIAAENLGYAAVELKETIARGAPGCVVVVHLKPRDEIPPCREYFRRDEIPAGK